MEGKREINKTLKENGGRKEDIKEAINNKRKERMKEEEIK